MECFCLPSTAGSKEDYATFKLLALIRQIKTEEGKRPENALEGKQGDHYLFHTVKI